MTKTAADRIADRLDAAQAAFEAGFASKAAQKRALDDLNRAYDRARDAARDVIISHANATPGLDTNGDARIEFFNANDLPFDLHQVRDRHVEIIAKWSDFAPVVRELIALRAAIKAAEIAPAPAKPEIEVRAEAVRRSVVEEIERRKAQYVEALEIGRLFNGLPVSVNAHLVHGHKGAVFVRHFFYLRGKLTPLNIILAAADTLEAEKAPA